MSFIAGLRCTVCRSPDLDFSAHSILCRRCGQQCPVLGGVPVMFETVSVRSGTAVDEPAARQVLAAFELPDDPLSLLNIRSLMRQQVLFGGSLIQVESQQFLDRVRSSGHDIAPEASLPDTPASPARPGVMPDLAVVPRYGWSKNYMPRRVKAATEFLANMRLENRGNVAMLRDGPGRVMVAARWQDPDGTAMPVIDMRTPLPIDLQPGQAVTLAVRIVPPARPGSCQLILTLVQEQVRWLDDDRITMTIQVEPEIPEPLPDGWVLLDEPPASYNADHLRGRDLLESWLAAHVRDPRSGPQPYRPRVLEVGGNVFPMSAGMEIELVNVDVDLLGLQIGRLVARRRGLAMSLVCADAFNLPFAAGYFDAIVIFASLHHFPDPAALLEQLRHKLRPGGFIGLFCEPVGHIWPGAIDEPFLAELEKGVNEQSFSLREYELMFRQADLDAAEVVDDRNSLKARLIHAPHDEAVAAPVRETGRTSS